MNRISRRWLVFAFAACPLTVFGGELPKSFTLGKYVPADSWFMVHAVHNPERDYLGDHWQDVFDRLKESGLDKDIGSLIRKSIPESEREAFQGHWDTISTALRAVPWSKLGSREIAFSQRMGAPMPKYLVLFRSEPDQVDAHVSALSEVLNSFAKLNEKLKVEELKMGGTHVWRMAIDGPLVIELFKHGELVGISTGSEGVSSLQPLLKGDGKATAFVDTPEFSKALAGVETPEDMIMYFGIHRLLEQMRVMIGDIDGMKKNKGEKMANANDVQRIITHAMDRLDVIDNITVSMRTEGLREFSNEVVTLLPDAANKPFAKAIMPRMSFKQFDRYVPADATGFTCSTFMDLNAMYEMVIDFLKTEFPEDSKEWLAKWEEKQAGVDFHLKNDVLSWISGEMVSVTLPGVGMQAGGVLMVRLSDAKLAKEKIDGFVKRLQAKAEETQLMISPVAEIETEGFYSVMHPMMMMAQVRPVIGVHDEWLMIGMGPRDVNKVIEAGKEGAETFRQNERFKNEAVPMSGDIVAASFADLSTMGQEMAMAMSMTGMMGAMMIQGEGAEPVRAIFGMMAKLGPVVAELDFFNSSSSVTKFDGRRWNSRTVLNYKPREIEQAQAD